MEKTIDCSVVAVYEDLSDAQDAARDLEKAGVKHGYVHVSSGELTGTPTDTRTAVPTDSETFTGWLKSIFTSDKHEHHQNYTNAYARGKHILSVEAADSQLRVIMSVLNRYSPIDIHTDDYGAMHGMSTPDTYIWEFPQPPSESDARNAGDEVAAPVTTTGSVGIPAENRGVRVYRNRSEGTTTTVSNPS